MELINKKNDKITAKTKVDLDVYLKIEHELSILFSAGAAIKFGLVPGLFIHFQNDEDRWYFYCNTDKDGFQLCSIGGKGRKGIRVSNKALVNLIRKRTLVSIGTKFPVILTNCKFNNHHLLEICFNKPFEDIHPAVTYKNNLKKVAQNYPKNIIRLPYYQKSNLI